MTTSSIMAPRGNSVLGLTVTIAVHAGLALVLLLTLNPARHSARAPIPPEPVSVTLLREVPPKPALKPRPAPAAVIHPPMPQSVPQPVLAVPRLMLAEQPKQDSAKTERAVAIPPPAAMTPPPAASAPSPTEMLDFQSRLMAHLNSFKRYPAEAKRQGKTGVVTVRFRIDRQGHVLSCRIEQGSGHAMLDEETTHLMQRADPFPAAPDSVPGAELEFVVPVQYKLG